MKKIWGMKDGRRIQTVIHENDEIKQYIVENNKIRCRIKGRKDISLTPSQHIITVRKTGIGITSNKQWSRNHAISKEYIHKVIEKGDITRNIYIPLKKPIINERILLDIEKMAMKYNVDISAYRNQSLDRQDIISMCNDILKRIPYRNTDYMRLREIKKIVRKRVCPRYLRLPIHQRLPKYLVPARKEKHTTDDEKPKKKYPSKRNIKKQQKRKVIAMNTFLRMVKSGEITSYNDIKQYKIRNTAPSPHIFSSSF